jgi:Flp pilus assembly pilin Flp
MLNELALRVLVAAQAVARAAEARFRDQDGQTLAEYGLILAVVAVAVVVTAGVLFRNSIVGAFGSGTKCLKSAPSSSTC